MLELRYPLIACEMLVAAQDVDQRPGHRCGLETASVYAFERRLAPTMIDNRPLGDDIMAIASSLPDERVGSIHVSRQPSDVYHASAGWSFLRDYLANAYLSDLPKNLDTVILHDEPCCANLLPVAILPNIEALEDDGLLSAMGSKKNRRPGGRRQRDARRAVPY